MSLPPRPAQSPDGDGEPPGDVATGLCDGVGVGVGLCVGVGDGGGLGGGGGAGEDE